MFDDLNLSLATLCTDSGAPAELLSATVTFTTPDKDFNPASPTVNFFLHGLQENRDLRSSVPVLTRSDDHFTSSVPPIRMDCTYLVTAWSGKTGELKVAEEHRLLGMTLLWLGQHPMITDQYLKGSLKTPAQPFPVSTQLAQTGAEEHLSHFWSALGIAPRPTFGLTVTIAMQLSPDADEVPRVETVTFDVVSAEFPTLAGRVFDASMQPVPNATVTLVQLNRHVTSDSRGAFSFGELPVGTYTLLTQAIPHPDLPETIDFQATEQLHVVQLAALTGRVSDVSMQPVPGATVTLVEPNQQVTADSRGAFRFDDATPFGTYTLRVQAANHPDLQQTINYQAADQVHDVKLSAQ